MTVGDNKDHIKVLLYSSYTTNTGWGLLLSNTVAAPAHLLTG